MGENAGIRKESSAMRKCNKPLMEKRRRARINDCLTQLKALVLQALKKDSSQFSKLEKADILELTVKHLRNLQRGQFPVAMATDNKYSAGFSECANEVIRYLTGIQGVDGDVSNRLIAHLAGCVKSVAVASPVPQTVTSPTHQPRCLQPIHVQIPPASNHIKTIPESVTSSSLPSAPLSQSQSPTSIGYQGQITGAFHIVPSSLCSTNTVAVYLGAPVSTATASAMTSTVPVYSLQVPPTASVPIAFVPPTVSNQTVSPMKAEPKDIHPLNLDLKASRKSEVKGRYQPYPASMVSCGSVAIASEKVWRPW